MLIHFSLLGQIQTKHGYEVVIIISQTMDILEASNTQSLANSLHEFMEYHKCLQWFNETENDHKDFLKQQRFGFIVKRLKEFDMANARKLEAIKWDWNPLWHIVSNDKCLLVTERPKLPWLHYSKEVEIIGGTLLRRRTPFKSFPWEVRLIKVFF
jgi:hypothetical protein